MISGQTRLDGSALATSRHLLENRCQPAGFWPRLQPRSDAVGRAAGLICLCLGGAIATFTVPLLRLTLG